jgi:hypothetical protein
VLAGRHLVLFAQEEDGADPFLPDSPSHMFRHVKVGGEAIDTEVEPVLQPLDPALRNGKRHDGEVNVEGVDDAGDEEQHRPDQDVFAWNADGGEDRDACDQNVAQPTDPVAVV